MAKRFLIALVIMAILVMVEPTLAQINTLCIDTFPLDLVPAGGCYSTFLPAVFN